MARWEGLGIVARHVERLMQTSCKLPAGTSPKGDLGHGLPAPKRRTTYVLEDT